MLPRKREGSFNAQGRVPPAKVPKHHRSNSSSLSKDKQEQAIHILKTLILYCEQLEKLLEVETHDGSTAHSTVISSKKMPASSSKATLYPGELLKQVNTAMEKHADVKAWLVSDANALPGKQPSQTKSFQAIDEEDEDVKVEDKHNESNRLSFGFLKQIVWDLHENVELLTDAQLVANIENLKVEIIPFSSVIADDYGKLAIQGYYDEVELEHLWEGVNEPGTTSNPVTFEGSLCFTKRLETAQAFVNPWSEMTARKIIDAYLDSVNDPQIFPSIHGSIVISPEFGILGHAKKKEPNVYPIINRQKHLKTYLNGSADYLTILVSGLEIRKHMDQARKQQWRSDSGRKAWLEGVMSQAKQTPKSSLSICEAKWPGAKLEQHIPQVVAEAIGLQLNTGCSCIPFCLSNGVEWVFGALHGRGDKDSASNLFWVTKIYRVDSALAAVRVLCILQFWAVSNEEKVWNLGCPEHWKGTLVQKLQGTSLDAPPSEVVRPEEELQPGYKFPKNTKTKLASGTGGRGGRR